MLLTPEQTLAYAKENGLYDGLLFATMNNKKEYLHSPAVGQPVIENGEMFFQYHVSDTETENLTMETMPRDQYEFLKKHIDTLCVEFILSHGEYHMIMSYGDEGKDAAYEKLNDMIALDFIQYANINTPGKLKTVISVGQEMYKEQQAMLPKMMNIEEFRKQMGLE